MDEEMCIVEAALFVSDAPLSPEELAERVGLAPEACERALNRLMEEYERRGGGIEVVLVGERYLMQVSPRYAPRLRGIAEVELPAPVLRTLAMIAYHQPIRQSDLAERRGNSAYAHVRTLVERGLVEATPQGHTKVLTTTPLFARYFQLQGADAASVKRAMLEMLHIPRLACTPMSAPVLRLAGVHEFEVLDLSRGEMDLSEYDAVVCLKGHVGPWSAKRVIEVSCITFSSLAASLDALAEYGTRRDIKRAKGRIEEALGYYRRRATRLGVRVNPLTPMARRMVEELGLDVSDGGITIATDLYEGDARVRIPTHANAADGALKRVMERYEAMLKGLEGVR